MKRGKSAKNKTPKEMYAKPKPVATTSKSSSKVIVPGKKMKKDLEKPMNTEEKFNKFM